MNSYKQQQLRTELSQAGATAAELKQLLPVAANLSLLKETSAKTATGSWLKIAKPAAFVASGLTAGMLLIVVSQAALPTSWLYPVQKLSDNVAVSLHPQYRANIMMKRAQQVNALVANHADSRQVMATLADYSREASAYRAAAHTNYAAFEYCKTNLEQAAAAASPEVRQAINGSLQSLETT